MNMDKHLYLGVLEDEVIAREKANFQIHPVTKEKTSISFPEGYSHIQFLNLKKKGSGSLLSYFNIKSKCVSSVKHPVEKKEITDKKGISRSQSKYFTNKNKKAETESIDLSQYKFQK